MDGVELVYSVHFCWLTRPSCICRQ